MSPMTSHERFRRMIAFQETNCVPIIDSLWYATIERGQREGLPAGMSCVDYLLARQLGGCQ